MIIGLGTLLNIGTIVLGAAIGVLIGNRLPGRTNRVVTDALGLITIVLGGLNLVALTDSDFVGAVGAAARAAAGSGSDVSVAGRCPSGSLHHQPAARPSTTAHCSQRDFVGSRNGLPGRISSGMYYTNGGQSRNRTRPVGAGQCPAGRWAAPLNCARTT